MTLTLAVGQRVRPRAGDHVGQPCRVLGFRDRAPDFGGDPARTGVLVLPEDAADTRCLEVLAPGDVEPIGDEEETG